MPPLVALILCTVFVIILLRIERLRNPEASSALWVPTFWLLLCGSRPLGRWFEQGEIVSTMSEEDGSPLDRMVLSILIALAVLIVIKRKVVWSRIVKDNSWLVLLFLFLGLSVLWSDFPLVSFKRWIRLSVAIPIAMVVLSERSPLNALESVFRRCAYVLIPFSLLLIKYFPDFGVQYNRWTGATMWVGVTCQKNGLGVVCALSAFFIIWAFHRDWRAGTFLKTISQVFADGSVLAIALFQLRGFRGQFAATAIGFLIVGIGSLLLLYRMKHTVKRTATILTLMTGIVLLCLTFSDSLVATITSAFQRNPTFTGRTDIWQAVLDDASRNPVLGVGYGAYWGLQDQIISSTYGAQESHSGYLDIYLDVGMVGLVLFLVFLLDYHRRALRELNHAHDWGVFGICMLLMALVHGFTESNFLRTSSYFWNSMIFMTVIFSAPYLHLRTGR